MLKALLVCAVMLACMLQAFAGPACHAARGSRVTLFGGVDDPDVLVWDSQDRLTRYAGGSVDSREFLLPHALLNRPGTRAVIVGCRLNAVHPKFSGAAADALGVLIMSGKYRGRYGWVSSGDVHGPGISRAQDSW